MRYIVAETYLGLLLMSVQKVPSAFPAEMHKSLLFSYFTALLQTLHAMFSLPSAVGTKIG